MKRALLLVVVTGCIDQIDERWQLDHDHVVVARATPPRIRPGDATNIDALVAHAGRGVSVENPLSAEVGSAQLASYLTSHDGTWTLTAPATPVDDPVPVDVMLTFPRSLDRSSPDPVRVKKTVWLGEPADNPVMPAVTVDGVVAGDEVVVPIGHDIYLSLDTSAAPDLRVNWLTSVGTLFQDDEPTSFVRVAPTDRLEGELVVVVRDARGGVAWQVWPMRAQ